MCHGFCSDKNSRGRFPRLANRFNEIGYNAFAFDFSGCGESENDSLTMAKEVDDLKSAIAFIKSKGFHKIALYGHSLGTVISLKCFSPDIITMVLSGAGTDSMKYDWNEFYSKEQIKGLEEKGYLTEKTDGVRREIIIDQQMLNDFELVKQDEL
jgi:pimeloyl-ACP methyl ester carboxylesterase